MDNIHITLLSLCLRTTSNWTVYPRWTVPLEYDWHWPMKPPPSLTLSLDIQQVILLRHATSLSSRSFCFSSFFLLFSSSSSFSSLSSSFLLRVTVFQFEQSQLFFRLNKVSCFSVWTKSAVFRFEQSQLFFSLNKVSCFSGWTKSTVFLFEQSQLFFRLNKINASFWLQPHFTLTRL